MLSVWQSWKIHSLIVWIFIYLSKTESNKKQKFSAWAQENHDDDEPRTLRLLSEPGNLHEDSSSDLRSSRILKTISKYSTKSLSSSGEQKMDTIICGFGCLISDTDHTSIVCQQILGCSSYSSLQASSLFLF